MRRSKLCIWGLLVLGLLVLSFGLGWWLSQKSSSQELSSSSTQVANKKPLYWVAPMNPNYRRDKPGKSPMGMDLVPVYAESNDPGVVKISPTIEHNLGVRTAVARLIKFQQPIRTVGYVQPNENTLKTISIYTKGWVKDLQVNSPGESVKSGMLLFKLYSPILISAQEEYLLALKHKNALLIRSGRQKLMTLGMSKKDIRHLAKTQHIQKNVPVYAPQSGYITQLNIRDGAHVMPATALMSIANLSKVWVIAEVFEQQAASLNVGQSVIAHFNSLPGESMRGKIDYIYPVLNAKTRTVRVRLIFPNVDHKLKPDMYANITIDTGHAVPVLAIPKEALIQLGDTDRVVLALGRGRFKPIKVKVGQYNKKWVSITHGLSVGQKVVTSSQFLLDSESNLKAGLDRLDHAHENKEGETIQVKEPHLKDKNVTSKNQDHYNHMGH